MSDEETEQPWRFLLIFFLLFLQGNPVSLYYSKFNFSVLKIVVQNLQLVWPEPIYNDMKFFAF